MSIVIDITIIETVERIEPSIGRSAVDVTVTQMPSSEQFEILITTVHRNRKTELFPV